MVQASFESVPSVLETLEARHRLGSCLKQRVNYGSPTLEESHFQQERRATTQRPIFVKGADSNLQGWQPKETRLNCHTTAGPTA